MAAFGRLRNESVYRTPRPDTSLTCVILQESRIGEERAVKQLRCALHVYRKVRTAVPDRNE